MKTVGLIGGMSWESTIPYYKTINELIKEKLGGLHSAQIILYSVEFDESWNIGTQMITNLIVKVYAYTQWQ